MNHLVMYLAEIHKIVIDNHSTCMQDWDRQNPTQIVTEMCGFVTILSGTFLLHKTKDLVDGTISHSSFELCKMFKSIMTFHSTIIGLPPTLMLQLLSKDIIKES